ncbi:MAG TPA: UDP-2,3-diacylglucosamine diphosphatase [Burkholderiaceae bacterium]|nr:UDP-2,3-diacylglucosamine diphosphatase [Burkholderiaceae bacterium]
MNLAAPPPVLAGAATVAPLVDPLFISDLHLTAERPRTIARFLELLHEDVPRHGELVILGDLFEFWIGDDSAVSARPVIDALAKATARGTRLLLMQGNRDLLLGAGFAAATGGTLLADPIVVDVAGAPTLLSHGDAWCTRDLAYQQFRAMTRQPQFQRDFLSRSIDDRLAFIRGLRMQSESEKSTKAEEIMDVTADAVVTALRSAGVRRVIHGHTHRPGAHIVDLGDALAERWVLPDWDLDDGETRGGFLECVDGRPRLVFFD